MKVLTWILWIFLLLTTLSTVIITPLAWIGVLLVAFGIYQKIQKDKGKLTFSKPGIIIAAGFFLSWILAFALVEPTKTTQENTTKQQNEINKSISNQEQQKEKNTADNENNTEENNETIQTEVTETVQDVQATQNQTQSTASNDTNTNSNLNSNTEIKNETPISQPVNTPTTTESYKNCKELNAVYPNGVPSNHPAYASKHDRDKDGWACEK